MSADKLCKEFGPRPMLFLYSANFFHFFFKTFVQNHYQSDKQFESRSDSGPNCLQRLSTDDKCHL